MGILSPRATLVENIISISCQCKGKGMKVVGKTWNVATMQASSTWCPQIVMHAALVIQSGESEL